MANIHIEEQLCNKCNTCSSVCIMQIIEKANGSNFPNVLEANEKNCMKCGHCESFCTKQALTLNYQTEEKINITPLDGQIKEQELALYLKKRRSVRYFVQKPVQKETIEKVLDVARYAASGGNAQPVKWLVVYDSTQVKRISELTIEWMRTILGTKHPYAAFIPGLVQAWDNGVDLICRNAPHLLIAHLPVYAPDTTDAIIALTHVDITAPSFGLGTCWAGFVKMAMENYKPLLEALNLPPRRKAAYGLMFGYPTYKINSIPRRKPLDIIWS